MSGKIRNPFDEAKLKEERQEREAQKASFDEAFKESLTRLLGTRDGKIVFNKLFSDCALFSSSFDTNALAMANKEGKKTFGLVVLSYVMTYCPEQYTEIRKISDEYRK